MPKNKGKQKDKDINEIPDIMDSFYMSDNIDDEEKKSIEDYEKKLDNMTDEELNAEINRDEVLEDLQKQLNDDEKLSEEDEKRLNDEINNPNDYINQEDVEVEADVEDALNQMSEEIKRENIKIFQALQGVLDGINNNEAVKSGLYDEAKSGIDEITKLIDEPDNKDIDAEKIKIGIACMMMNQASLDEASKGNNRIGSSLSKNKDKAISYFTGSKVVDDLTKQFIDNPDSISDFAKDVNSNIKKILSDHFTERREIRKEAQRKKQIERQQALKKKADNLKEKKAAIDEKIIKNFEAYRTAGQKNPVLSPYLNNMLNNGITELELLFVEPENPNIRMDFVKQGIAAIMMNMASAHEMSNGKNHLGEAIKKNPESVINLYVKSDVVDRFSKQIKDDPAKMLDLFDFKKVRELNKERSIEGKNKLKVEAENRKREEERKKAELEEKRKAEEEKRKAEAEKKKEEEEAARKKQEEELAKQKQKQEEELAKQKQKEVEEAAKLKEEAEKQKMSDEKAFKQEKTFMRGLNRTEVMRAEADEMKTSFKKDIATQIVDARDELTGMVGRTELNKDKLKRSIASIMVCSQLKKNMPDINDPSTDKSREFVSRKIDELIDNPAFGRLINKMDSDSINEFLEGRGEDKFLKDLVSESQRMYEIEERLKSKAKDDNDLKMGEGIDHSLDNKSFSGFNIM